MSVTQEELEEFSVYLKKRGAAKNTIISYQSAVRQYFLHFSEITVSQLLSYRKYLIRSYLPNTVNARIYGINQYLRYLDSLHGTTSVLIENYHVPAVKRQQKSFMDNVISNEDYESLKTHLKQDRNFLWYFIVRFLGATGARVSELVQIKVEHLQLGYIDLYSKGGKIRRIYFPDTLCCECLTWLYRRQISSGFIFINRQKKTISPRGINSQLKKLARLYGIDPNTVYAHSFRHLYAKNFLQKFNDISLLADLLGHESIETTKIYLTQSSAEQKALLDKIIVW